MQSSSASSSRGPLLRSAFVLVLLIAAAGCAGKRPMVRPPAPPTESTRQPGDTTMPEPAPRRPLEEPAPSASKPSEASDDFVALPGLNRVYPSEDPTNAIRPGAAEAFPAPGHSALADARSTRTSVNAPIAEAAPTRDPKPSAAAPAANQAKPKDAASSKDEPKSASPPPAKAPVQEIPAPASTPQFCLQLFATGSEKAAEARRAAIAGYLELPLRVEEENGLYKVRSHPIDRKAAEHWLDAAVAQGYEDAFLVPVTSQGSR